MFALFSGMAELSHAVMFAHDPFQAEMMTFGMCTNILVIIWFQQLRLCWPEDSLLSRLSIAGPKPG